MLLCSLTIRGSSGDGVDWNITLRYDKEKTDDTKIARINSIVDDVAKTLEQLKTPSKENKNKDIETIKNALFDANLRLSSLHGLTAADGEASRRRCPLR